MMSFKHCARSIIELLLTTLAYVSLSRFLCVVITVLNTLVTGAMWAAYFTIAPS
jgi:hypothetical protein